MSSDKDIDVFGVDDANKENQKEYDKRRAREIDDLKAILKMPTGRRFVLRMLCEMGMFHTPFALNSMQMSFNCGKHDLGLWLTRELDMADPMVYSQMLREHYSELKSKKKQEE